MRKVVIKLSQGSVVTQTVLGGLTIHLPVANFLRFISAKNYENWLRVDKVIAMNTVCSFLAHPVFDFDLILMVDNPRFAAGISMISIIILEIGSSYSPSTCSLSPVSMDIFPVVSRRRYNRPCRDYTFGD